MAERYHWPQTVTAAQDPYFIDEVLGFIEAKATHDQKEAKRKEAEAEARAKLKGGKR